jgi:peptidoglycan/LPS O-acetylase OafA/YrhL
MLTLMSQESPIFTPVKHIHAERIVGLDLLRCLAISGVLLSHSLYFIYPHVPAINLGALGSFHLYHLGHLGFYGVELFFVLSGFLIGGLLIKQESHLSGSKELIRFYLRRWFRTLPNYYLFIILNGVLASVAVPGILNQSKLIAYVLFLQNLFSANLNFFLESWSLAIEEWFYLIYALLAFLFLRNKRSSKYAYLYVGIVLYLISTLGRVLFALDESNTWEIAQREIVILRFDALMTGVLGAWLFRNYPTNFNNLARLSLWIGLIILIGCYGTLYLSREFNAGLFAKSFRFNCVSLGFALLIPSASRIIVQSPNIISSCIESLARWSYSMYFVNLPLMYFIKMYIFPNSQRAASQGWYAFVTEIIGTILISAIIYNFYESKLTNLRDRFSLSK